MVGSNAANGTVLWFAVWLSRDAATPYNQDLTDHTEDLGAAAGKTVGLWTRIFIYETTLRDGQAPGGGCCNLFVPGQLPIASRARRNGDSEFIGRPYPLRTQGRRHFRAVRERI